jgi:hypothetical protein
MFGEVRINLFFVVPNISFSPAFDTRRPVRVFGGWTESLYDSAKDHEPLKSEQLFKKVVAPKAAMSNTVAVPRQSSYAKTSNSDLLRRKSNEDIAATLAARSAPMLICSVVIAKSDATCSVLGSN